MIQNGCLEVEHSFLLRPRVQCSPRLSGMLLCGSVTPRYVSFRIHWMLRWGLISWLPYTLSTTLNCPSFSSWLLGAPLRVVLLEAFWLYSPPLQELPVLASCTVRPSDWAIGDGCSASIDLMWILASWGGLLYWLVPCWAKLNTCLCTTESLRLIVGSFKLCLLYKATHE